MTGAPPIAAVPFIFKRSSEELGAASLSTTTETVHGVARLHRSSLILQWRLARKTEHLGATGVRTDREVEDVREMEIPLASVAGGEVRRRWWQAFSGPRLVLRAADLKAFEGMAGPDGLKLDHPGELILRVRRSDRLIAEEFVGELAMAVARLAGSAESAGHLSPRARGRSLPPPAGS